MTGYLYMRLAQKLHFLRHQSFINNSHRPGDQRSRTADIPDQRALFKSAWRERLTKPAVSASRMVKCLAMITESA